MSLIVEESNSSADAAVPNVARVVGPFFDILCCSYLVCVLIAPNIDDANGGSTLFSTPSDTDEAKHEILEE